MSYRVRTESFEGPFDLLLYLVSRQRVDIGAIHITEIADQYLAEVAMMPTLDLDVASDFLLVAATLLEIKAASLIPKPQDDDLEELEEMSPSEARDLLIERLVTYKQFKNATAELAGRGEAESRLHRRTCGPDPSLLTLMPDYLERVSLDQIAAACARVLGHQDPFLLESEHIAAKRIPLEVHLRAIHARIANRSHARFFDLVAKDGPAEHVVVTFLAVLELYKRGMVRVSQPEPFGDIDIDYIEGSGELLIDEEHAITSESEVG